MSDPIDTLAAVWNLSPNDPRRRARHLHLVHRYGKWSMLDVLVVAVLIVSVKLGALARVEIHYGFYAFATAVLLSMLITALSVRAAERRKCTVQKLTSQVKGRGRRPARQ